MPCRGDRGPRLSLRPRPADLVADGPGGGRHAGDLRVDRRVRARHRRAAGLRHRRAEPAHRRPPAGDAPGLAPALARRCRPSCWASGSRPCRIATTSTSTDRAAGAAVRGPDGRLAALGRPSGFVLEQWLKADGDGRRPGALAAASGGGRCDRLGCTARLADGRAVALVRDRRAFARGLRPGRGADHRPPAPPTCTGPSSSTARISPTTAPWRSGPSRDGFTTRYARSRGRGLPWRLRPDPQAAPRPAGDASAGPAQRPRRRLMVAPTPNATGRAPDVPPPTRRPSRFSSGGRG